MDLHPSILTEIHHYGADLAIMPDPERPWACQFIARLSRRNQRPLIGRGDNPSAAIADLNLQITPAALAA
jgi:hypothetical protein